MLKHLFVQATAGKNKAVSRRPVDVKISYSKEPDRITSAQARVDPKLWIQWGVP